MTQLDLGITTALHDEEVVIYVASPISSLAGEQREEIEQDCAVIKATAEAVAATDQPPWPLTAHVPCLESSPWVAPDTPPEQVFDRNHQLVAEEADALILHGGWGGSVGAGQELAWAAAVRLPTLFLHKREHPATSRQVKGTPIDLEIADFSSRLELVGTIVDYVHRRRHAIQSHARHRASRLIGLESLVSELRTRWDSLDPRGRQSVIATARLHPRRVETLLSRPALLRAASLDEILALCGALAMDAGRYLTGDPMPILSREQLDGLRTAAVEFDWDAGLTLDLMLDAQLELARGGTRRLSLTTPDDWNRFKESRQR